MPRHALLHLLRALLMSMIFIGGAPVLQAATIVVVLNEAKGPYQEFADTLRTELARDAQNHEIIVIDSEQAIARSLSEAQLVIGVGGRAMEVLAAKDFKAPLLLSLVTRSAYEKLPAARRDDRKTTGLFIDQPPARYINLVRAALPSTERIGFLVGRDSRDNVSRLMQIARERKLQPAMENVAAESDIYPAIQRLFPDGGVLIATPDTAIFNSLTIPNIILSAYRFRVPLIGFSQGSVKSGALIAVFSTPAQLAQQTAEIAHKTLAGTALPAPQYPRLFSIGINSGVARNLNIDVETEAAIRDRMERFERVER